MSDTIDQALASLDIAEPDPGSSGCPSDSLCDSHTFTNNTASESSNIPQLPTELMIKIFKFAQHQDICLTSLLRTTKLNYSLVWPMIYKNKTLHLNRETLPGLATFMSINLIGSNKDTPARKKELNLEKMEILERRRRLLAGITTLVIGDVQVMFGWEYSHDFANFCSTIVLPKVTKIIWREDKLRERGKAGLRMIPGHRAGTWIKPPPGVSDAEIDVELQRRRSKQFIPVLPAKVKKVCIIVPGSGYFQDLGYQHIYHYTERPWFFSVSTIERIGKYVARFTGDVTVRVHQPVSDSYIHLFPVRNTIYSFFSDYWDVPARTRLINAYDIVIAKRLERNYDYSQTWAGYLFPTLSDILSGDSNREEMLDSCKTAIWSPEYFDLGGNDKTNEGGDFGQWLLGLVKEMIEIINSDHKEVECRCCGTVGTSLKAWKTQVYT